ncbi:uncharacterized protein Z518_01161 [Rhinocladiella mackenziei CBS 650.93]|uniref:Rhinocladiella mackenziei CBS 650.93 unplaced genomic scaffold supercont1.1, whole genome shotgun sequence n=1 Tax=Rhinocladiella mackenziei CBS 650.93 TaxID=1442369 RepID=A0A0D2JKV1_9EURO|nr:uncharacterized protein Z518_01161 [Rhinocladiella mackenziei CBS 650.93]KIX10080.1 hypothetical protein Z518_01161 [Rhinocladiella mackenziei CBS 650.93]
MEPARENVDRDDDEQTIRSLPQSFQKFVSGDFRSLLNMRPPDISQHPVFQPNPLSSISDAPLMITTYSTAQIREEKRRIEFEKERERAAHERRDRYISFSYQGFSNAFDSASSSRGRIEPHSGPSNTQSSLVEGAMNLCYSERFSNPPATAHRIIHQSSGSYATGNNLTRLQTNPDNEETDIYGILAEGSPTTTSSSQPRTPVDSGKATTTTPISEGSEQKMTGLRIVTDLFKPRTGVEKSQTDDTQRALENLSPCRSDLERHLRITTNCHTYDYTPGDPLPRHPNTSRGWNSRNLHCTTCIDEFCAVCGRACCAFKAALLAKVNHEDNEEALRMAEERILHICHIYPFGMEAPTFLQCIRGDEIGCGKIVCPDCCGICPNEICRDIQCRKCKKIPWEECLWHVADMNGRAI